MNNYLSLDKLSWALQFLEWLMHFFNCINTPLRSYFHRLRYNLSTFFFKDELSFSLFELFFKIIYIDIFNVSSRSAFASIMFNIMNQMSYQ